MCSPPSWGGRPAKRSILLGVRRMVLSESTPWPQQSKMTEMGESQKSVGQVYPIHTSVLPCGQLACPLGFPTWSRLPQDTPARLPGLRLAPQALS